jgi:hypothetical protein
MSIKGIKMFAGILSEMQETRGKLLAMATKGSSGLPGHPVKHPKPVDFVDLRLGQMLEEMKDSAKHEFTALTLKKGV